MNGQLSLRPQFSAKPSEVLLDTHVLLWWLADDDKLSVAAREAIGDVATQICVSAASAWELAIKASLGKLTAPDDLSEQLCEFLHSA